MSVLIKTMIAVSPSPSNMSSSTPTIQKTQVINATEPSMDNPTPEYLHKLTKVQLQKHSRKLGITNVWAKKEQLVEMILAKHNIETTPPCSAPSPSKRSGAENHSSDRNRLTSFSSDNASESVVHSRGDPSSAASQGSDSVRESETVVHPRGDPSSAASQGSDHDSLASLSSDRVSESVAHPRGDSARATTPGSDHDSRTPLSSDNVSESVVHPRRDSARAATQGSVRDNSASLSKDSANESVEHLRSNPTSESEMEN